MQNNNLLFKLFKFKYKKKTFIVNFRVRNFSRHYSSLVIKISVMVNLARDNNQEVTLTSYSSDSSRITSQSYTFNH